MSADLKQLAALTALNAMFSKNYFDICTIDSVATMLQVNPKGETYDLLRTMHCVHYDKMPRELRGQLPDLVMQCLGGPQNVQFTLVPAPSQSISVEVVRLAPQKRGLFQLLGVTK